MRRSIAARASVSSAGHEPRGVTQDELDIGIVSPNLIAHQQVCRTRGIQQEIGRERQHAVDGGTRQIRRMNEHHRATRIQDAEQICLAVLAQVHTGRVGQQNHTVGVQFIQRPDRLLG